MAISGRILQSLHKFENYQGQQEENCSSHSHSHLPVFLFVIRIKTFYMRLAIANFPYFGIGWLFLNITNLKSRPVSIKQFRLNKPYLCKNIVKRLHIALQISDLNLLLKHFSLQTFLLCKCPQAQLFLVIFVHLRLRQLFLQRFSVQLGESLLPAV